MIDLATRVHNHNYKMDPIVRDLLDIDFYKLLMLQFIWFYYRDVQVTWAVKNRTKGVILFKDREVAAQVEEQLHHVSKLRFTNQALVWLQGNTFYGKQGIFKPEFIEFLRTFKLNVNHIDFRNDFFQGGEPGYQLSFSGSWFENTLWEIYALTITSEVRTRNAMKDMSKIELDILYANAKAKVWKKLKSLEPLQDLNLIDMGTRRRHSFLWQEWVIQACQEVLGKNFTGTSNVYLAMKYGLEAKGTNAHELPMVLTALAYRNGGDLKEAQYKVLEQWQELYEGNLLIALPDTFGTTQFLKDAPEFLNDWAGFRPDSKPWKEAGYELIDWWKSRNQDPTQKLVIFSDGLDTQDIIEAYQEFNGKVRLGFGWGTNLTNDFKGCHPDADNHDLDPISIVCKVKSVYDTPAIKLSDNLEKITGDKQVALHYIDVFGLGGMSTQKVKV